MQKILKLKYLLFVTIFWITHPEVLLSVIKTYLERKRCFIVDKTSNNEMVSIIIVTYNALDYVKLCLESLRKTKYKNYEVIVVDNNSDAPTKRYLTMLKKKKEIHKLVLSPENHYFTKGNNVGFSVSSDKSKYVLLLNSDVEIKNDNWLTTLLNNAPPKGIISIGAVFFPSIRPDGYCLLVNKSVYEECGGLNESFPMNGSITEFAAKVSKKGYVVRAIMNHEKILVHYGGKSYRKSKSFFPTLTSREIVALYKSQKIELLTL